MNIKIVHLTTLNQFLKINAKIKIRGENKSLPKKEEKEVSN